MTIMANIALSQTPSYYYSAEQALSDSIWEDIYNAIKLCGKKVELPNGTTEWTLTFPKNTPCFVTLSSTNIRLIKAVVSERPNVQVRDNLTFFDKDLEEVSDFVLKKAKQGFNIYSPIYRLYEKFIEKYKNVYEEVRNDHYDELRNATAIDGWKPNREVGEVVAWVFDNNEVCWVNPMAKFDQKVQEAVEEVKMNNLLP